MRCERLSYNKQRAGTVCPDYLLPYSRQNLSKRLAVRRRSKIFSSPNGFKIFKVQFHGAFAFGLISREFRGGLKLYRGGDGRLGRSDSIGAKIPGNLPETF